VPLVPAAVVGTERLTALRRWRVAFGEPVSLENLPPHPRLAAREATERLWNAISALETELLRMRNATSRRLRPRLVPDISLADLLSALRACLRARDPGAEQRVLDAWASGRSGLACLSVRSAFDLSLEALSFEPGDEVAVSAITHPDMVRVLEAHGLRALPVDVDPDTLEPRADLLERLVGPRTRALLVAHLFGARADLTQLAEVSRRHSLLLIEDCAQSFRGPDDSGSPLADISLFSFGAIKTATALGGSLVRVRDPELLTRMRRLHARWPAQGRGEYAARVLKFVGLVVLARPRPYWLFERIVRLARKDFDSFVADAVKGFPGPALLPRIRRRPSAALLALLERRLRRFDRCRLERRERLGEQAAEGLSSSLFHPGHAALERTHWVFPVVAPDRGKLAASLRRSGFDAAIATSSLASVQAPEDRPELAPQTADRIMSEIVFLPLYPEFDETEVEEMLATVARSDGHD
jgi:dTDP-4-amino-4,6-dideoxygalactose transaminase